MKRVLVFLIACAGLAACEPDRQDVAIPWQPFDVININLSLPEYIHLRSEGNYMYLNDGGVRGIIVYNAGSSNFRAYERNCSFQPHTACATVEVHPSTLYLHCPCCSSTFDLATGYPTGGIAWRPLNQYATSSDGSTLTITDQVVN